MLLINLIKACCSENKDPGGNTVTGQSLNFTTIISGEIPKQDHFFYLTRSYDSGG